MAGQVIAQSTSVGGVPAAWAPARAGAEEDLLALPAAAGGGTVRATYIEQVFLEMIPAMARMVVVCDSSRPFVVAMCALGLAGDLGNLTLSSTALRLAKKAGSPATTIVTARNCPKFRAGLRRAVMKANASLAAAGRGDCQIARLAVLHQNLDPESGLVRADGSLNRAMVWRKHAALIDLLYAQASTEAPERRAPSARSGIIEVGATQAGAVDRPRFKVLPYSEWVSSAPAGPLTSKNQSLLSRGWAAVRVNLGMSGAAATTAPAPAASASASIEDRIRAHKDKTSEEEPTAGGLEAVRAAQAEMAVVRGRLKAPEPAPEQPASAARAESVRAEQEIAALKARLKTTPGSFKERPAKEEQESEVFRARLRPTGALSPRENQPLGTQQPETSPQDFRHKLRAAPASASEASRDGDGRFARAAGKEGAASPSESMAEQRARLRPTAVSARVRADTAETSREESDSALFAAQGNSPSAAPPTQLEAQGGKEATRDSVLPSSAVRPPSPEAPWAAHAARASASATGSSAQDAAKSESPEGRQASSAVVTMEGEGLPTAKDSDQSEQAGIPSISREADRQRSAAPVASESLPTTAPFPRSMESEKTAEERAAASAACESLPRSKERGLMSKNKIPRPQDSAGIGNGVVSTSKALTSDGVAEVRTQAVALSDGSNARAPESELGVGGARGKSHASSEGLANAARDRPSAESSKHQSPGFVVKGKLLAPDIGPTLGPMSAPRSSVQVEGGGANGAMEAGAATLRGVQEDSRPETFSEALSPTLAALVRDRVLATRKAKTPATTPEKPEREGAGAGARAGRDEREEVDKNMRSVSEIPVGSEKPSSKTAEAGGQDGLLRTSAHKESPRDLKVVEMRPACTSNRAQAQGRTGEDIRGRLDAEAGPNEEVQSPFGQGMLRPIGFRQLKGRDSGADGGKAHKVNDRHVSGGAEAVESAPAAPHSGPKIELGGITRGANKLESHQVLRVSVAPPPSAASPRKSRREGPAPPPPRSAERCLLKKGGGADEPRAAGSAAPDRGAEVHHGGARGAGPPEQHRVAGGRGPASGVAEPRLQRGSGKTPAPGGAVQETLSVGRQDGQGVPVGGAPSSPPKAKQVIRGVPDLQHFSPAPASPKTPGVAAGSSPAIAPSSTLRKQSAHGSARRLAASKAVSFDRVAIGRSAAGRAPSSEEQHELRDGICPEDSLGDAGAAPPGFGAGPARCSPRACGHVRPQGHDDLKGPCVWRDIPERQASASTVGWLPFFLFLMYRN
jgi:hypothetical protein